MSSIRTAYFSDLDSDDEPLIEDPNLVKKTTDLSKVIHLPQTPHESFPISISEKNFRNKNYSESNTASEKSTIQSRATSTYSGVQSKSSFNDDTLLTTNTNSLSQLSEIKNVQQKKSLRKRLTVAKLFDKRIYLNEAFLDQIINLEKRIWKYQQNDKMSNDMSENDAILRILQ